MRGGDEEDTARRDGRTRLWIGASLSAGAGVELESGQGHYLRHVLRLAPGAAVALFNARDGEWRAVIDGFAKDRCRLVVDSRRRAPEAPGAGLWLVFAPLKRARLETLIEKATELGVTRLVPVVTRHTDIGRVNLERLGAIAREAAEQCERLTVPELLPPTPFFQLLSHWPGLPLLVCAEAGPVRPLAAAVAALPPGPAAVLIGPEGGFANSELDELGRRPFVVQVGLGPRVLRAETAALAALACWQALRGDWSDDTGAEVRPPFRAGPS
ncbi:MAG: 16S rRNA (uracil(1498)-N(3))-methyltransferase [Rhodospirillaceae bacterium]